MCIASILVSQEPTESRVGTVLHPRQQANLLSPRYTQNGPNSQNPRTVYMIYLKNVQCAPRHELQSHYLNYKV